MLVGILDPPHLSLPELMLSMFYSYSETSALHSQNEAVGTQGTAITTDAAWDGGSHVQAMNPTPLRL